MNSSSPHVRARYDADGNIVLAEVLGETRGKSWTLLEEPKHVHASLPKAAPPLRAPSPAAPSVFHIMGMHMKKLFNAGLKEGERQIGETMKDAGKEFSKARSDVLNVPTKMSKSMQKIWHAAQTPVPLPSRRPGRRQYKKSTLFLIDTVRFGGTFGLIFGVLFVGINYQSFWQIARAELALGDDLGTQQALADITSGAGKTRVAYARSAGITGVNILAYLPDVGPFEDRIVIPKIGKNVPVVRPSMEALMKEDWRQFEKDIQTALRDGIVHYPGSARPGQAGNAFFTGHSSYYPWEDGNYKDVFARLNELDIGDTYAVYYGGDKHTYRVFRKYEVKPSDVSVLDQPSDKRISTLMTCTPVGTTLRRLIVQAEEIDPVTGIALNIGQKTENRANPFTRLDALPI